jgi:hypothetical protein
MTKPTSNKLTAANGPKTATGSASTAQAGTTPASSVKVASAAENAPNPNPPPKTWADIQVGSLVIAQEASEEWGWWEAVVTEVHGDLLTLRFRDYPKQSAIKRNRKALALLFPGE